MGTADILVVDSSHARKANLFCWSVNSSNALTADLVSGSLDSANALTAILVSRSVNFTQCPYSKSCQWVS